MCKVLTAESLAPLGYQPSDGKPFDWYDRGCQYDGKGSTVKFSAALDSLLEPDKGRPIDINGLPAAVSIDVDYSCEIDVRVGKDYFSMVIENVFGNDPAVRGKMCEVTAGFARQIASAAKPA